MELFVSLPVYDISLAEAQALQEIASSIQGSTPASLTEVVGRCAEAQTHIHQRLPQIVDATRQSMRWHQGIIHIRGLPAVENPLVLSIILGFLGGQVTRYANEGDYVVSIKACAERDAGRPSFQNSKAFALHTDLSYAPEPPAFFLLHSLRNDAQDGGFSTWCSLQSILSRLSCALIDALAQPQFIFPAPAHYQGNATIQCAVLQRDATGAWGIRYRRDGIRSTTRSGIDALAELVQAIESEKDEVSLEDNSVLFINNRTCLHGRTAFLVRPHATLQRHLHRVYMI